MEPELDKIVGTGKISCSTFSAYHGSSACVFACGSMFSVVIPRAKKRFDYKLTADIREITAISFAPTSQEIVVGEAGPNGRIFCVAFDKSFEKIISKLEIKTQENGFSFVAVSEYSQKLLTCSNDDQPFILLWDLTQAIPEVISYYHLNKQPKHVFMDPSGELAIVCGEGMLKFLNLKKDTQEIAPMICRNANIGRFANQTFIGSGINTKTKEIFAVTDEGTICSITAKYGLFVARNEKRTKPPLNIVPIHLRQPSTVVGVDDKLTAVGTQGGTIYAIIKEKEKLRVFGTFEMKGKSVSAISMTKHNVIAAYQDGTIAFWLRKKGSQPSLVINTHKGATNRVLPLPGATDILTCGSDGTVREWHLESNMGLVGKSSQGQLCIAKVVEPPPDLLTTITGVRAAAIIDDRTVIVGDYKGYLHLMLIEKLAVLHKTRECHSTITSLTSKDGLVIGGTSSGDIFSYRFANNSLSRIYSTNISSSPITTLVFCGDSVVVGTATGMFSVSKDNIEDVVSSNEFGVLSLSPFPNGKYVAASGLDGILAVVRSSDMSIFRSYRLTRAAYPLCAKVEPTSGLFIAAAMSDSTIRIVDPFSGDQLYIIPALSGLITDVAFQDGDIVCSAFDGFAVRWTMPHAVHAAIKEHTAADNPLFEILNTDDDSPPLDLPAAQPLVPSKKVGESEMRGEEPAEDLVFKEVENATDGANEEDAFIDANEEEEEQGEEQPSYLLPRQNRQGDAESRVDDIVRASFIAHSHNKVEEDDSLPVPLPSQFHKKDKDDGMIVLDLPKERPAGYRPLINLNIKDSDEEKPKSPVSEKKPMSPVSENPYHSLYEMIADVPIQYLLEGKIDLSKLKEEEKKDPKPKRSDEIIQLADSLSKVYIEAKRIAQNSYETDSEKASCEELKEEIEKAQKTALKQDWFKKIIIQKVRDSLQKV